MRFFKSVFYCVLSVASLHAAQAAPPNVVLINADDLGWAEVGCYGQKLSLIHISEPTRPY